MLNKKIKAHHRQLHHRTQPAATATATAMAAAAEDEDDALEQTLLVIRDVSVYKIPPRPTSGGYKCGEWLHSDKIWSGRLRVVCRRHLCEIRLEDPVSGDLFAASSFLPGHRDAAVETVLDSSRYFVLRVEDGMGKHAFVGLGFGERNEAFDFNVALSDHEKYVKREHDADESGAGGGDAAGDDGHIDIHPAVNHRLKEGETIRINVKPKPSAGTGMLSAAGLSGSGSGSGKPTLLAPPLVVGAGKIRSSLDPPPNDPAASKMNSGQGLKLSTPAEKPRKPVDSLSDLSPLERNLPSTAGSGSGSAKSASGWAAF